MIRGASWIAATDNTGASPIAIDVLGSVTDTGTSPIAHATNYDAYGNPDLANPALTLGYRGELTTNNHIHLRARTYHPTTGSFLTTDPVLGIPGTPTIANPYHYADNNPTNRYDPTGRTAEDATMPAGPDDAAFGIGVLTSLTQLLPKGYVAKGIAQAELYANASAAASPGAATTIGQAAPIAGALTGLVVISIGATEASKAFVRTSLYQREVSDYVDAVNEATTQRAVGVCVPGPGQSSCPFAGEWKTPDEAKEDVPLVPTPKLATDGSGARSGTGGNGNSGCKATNTPDGMLGANGTQVTSATLYTAADFHIDVENPAPGVRAGQLHVQDYAGNKYLYDFDSCEWIGIPKSLAKKLDRDPKVKTAIEKGARYLGL